MDMDMDGEGKKRSHDQSPQTLPVSEGNLLFFIHSFIHILMH